MKVFARLVKIIDGRHILNGMVIKRIRDKYVGSYLGILWAIINPVLIMLAVTFVFTQVTKTEIKNYHLLTLSAILPWFFFINSICESTTSMKDNADILRQFILPREIIPVSIVLADFLIFLFGFIVMLPIFIVFNIAIVKYLLLLPLIMFLHILFTLGISMLFSIVNVYFGDLSQLLSVGVMFLFWITPVFYPLEIIPQGYRWVIMINPGTCYIVIYRSILHYASFGDIYMWLFAIGFALLSLIIGYSVFLKKEAGILKCI